MAQRHKNLLRPAFLLSHVVGDDGDPAREPMLITKAGMNPFGCMALFFDPRFVLLEDLINDRDERIQLRACRWFVALISRRNSMFEDLGHCFEVDPEMTGVRGHPLTDGGLSPSPRWLIPSTWHARRTRP